MLLWLINCAFFAVFDQVYRKTSKLAVCGFQTNIFKMCFWSQAHLFASFNDNICIYLTFSFKEMIEGERYFEIRKKLYCISRSKIVVTIVILKYHSLKLEIPLFGINTTPLSRSNCRILSNHIIISVNAL